MNSWSNSKILIILGFKAEKYNPRLWLEARPHYLAPSEKLAMFGHVNKALLKQVKVVDQKKIQCSVESRFTKFPNRIIETHQYQQSYFNLIESKQTLYYSIYSLRPMELKTLKTYIETNLIKRFIWSFKSTGALKLIFLEVANLWIAWAISNIVFYLVKLISILWEKDLWSQQFEDNLPDP